MKVWNKTTRKARTHKSRNFLHSLAFERLDGRLVLSGITPAPAAAADGQLASDVCLVATAGGVETPGVPTQSADIVTGAGPGAVFGPHVRGWNGFAGSIPTELGNLTGPGPGPVYGPQVRGLNDLTGSIPTQLGNLTSSAGPGAVFGPHVRGWNDLTGNIPTQLGDLVNGPGPGDVFGPQARGSNNFTGPIPTQLGNLTGPGPGDVYGPHSRSSESPDVHDAMVVDRVLGEEDVDSFFDIWTEISLDGASGGNGLGDFSEADLEAFILDLELGLE